MPVYLLVAGERQSELRNASFTENFQDGSLIDPSRTHLRCSIQLHGITFGDVLTNLLMVRSMRCS